MCFPGDVTPITSEGKDGDGDHTAHVVTTSSSSSSTATAVPTEYLLEEAAITEMMGGFDDKAMLPLLYRMRQSYWVRPVVYGKALVENSVYSLIVKR